MRRGLWIPVALAATLIVRREPRADVAVGAPRDPASDGGAAASPGADERRARVVARVGTRAITVGELEDRLAQMPPFQRASFGATPGLARRNFLDLVLVRDALLAVGAEDEKLGDKPPAAYRIERARSAATVRAIREHIGPASAIPMADVEAYFAANRAHYETPERIQIWRILCPTREEAKSVLDAAAKSPTPGTFSALARDHSLDKATKLRAGNLGFVTADGASSEPGWRVDDAVVRAARAVRDGDLVPAPVAEGSYFSVVWRRGTIAATRRTVGDAAPQIRDVIWKARVKEETDKLVATLRAAHLRDLDTSTLGTIDLPSPHRP